KRHLESISRASDRLSGLVEDLLDVSRLRTGQLRLRRELVDIVPILEEVVERYETELLARGEHRVRLSAPPHPVQIEVDASRLEQVLDNFLSNAVKYSPNGGDIRVRLTVDGEGAEIVVTDHGIGLPKG